MGVIQVTEDVQPAPAEYPAMGDPFTAGVLEYGSTPALVSGSKGAGSPSHEGPLAMNATITGFDPSELEATEGEVAIEITNLDAFDHDFTIDELGVHTVFGAEETITATFEATPGTYVFYCSIPGHRESGMEGTLTVLSGAGH